MEFVPKQDCNLILQSHDLSYVQNSTTEISRARMFTVIVMSQQNQQLHESLKHLMAFPYCALGSKQASPGEDVPWRDFDGKGNFYVLELANVSDPAAKTVEGKRLWELGPPVRKGDQRSLTE